jgi:hypothetical protein
MVEKTSRLDYRKHRDNIVAACKTFLYFGFILCIACYILISVLGIYYPITNAIDKNNSNICYIYSGLYEWITEKSETLNQTTTSLTLSTNGVIIISVFVFSLAFTLTGLIMYRVCAIDLSRRADKIIISMIRVILITNVSLIVLLFAAFPFLTTTSGQFPSNLRT